MDEQDLQAIKDDLRAEVNEWKIQLAETIAGVKTDIFAIQKEMADLEEEIHNVAMNTLHVWDGDD